MIIIIFVIVLLSITLFSTACLQVNDIRMNYHLIAQHFYILKKKKKPILFQFIIEKKYSKYKANKILATASY